MEISQKHKDILHGKICPYCNSETKVVSEEYIYGKSYKGRSVICCVNFPKCDSYVGTHEEDGSSLGRLANNELRQYKKRAHEWFDEIWRSEYKTRDEAYEWLSETLGTPAEYTHIGMFSIPTCKKVITECIYYLEQMKSIVNEIKKQG